MLRKKQVRFFRVNLFYFLFLISRIISVLGYVLCVITVCGLLFIYALLEAVVEKCLPKIWLFKLSKILKLPVKVFIVTEVAGFRSLTLMSLELYKNYHLVFQGIVNKFIAPKCTSSYASNEKRRNEKLYFSSQKCGVK